MIEKYGVCPVMLPRNSLVGEAIQNNHTTSLSQNRPVFPDHNAQTRVVPTQHQQHQQQFQQQFQHQQYQPYQQQQMYPKYKFTGGRYPRNSVYEEPTTSDSTETLNDSFSFTSK